MITDEQLLSVPAIRELIARHNGLHKSAGAVLGVEGELDLRAVVTAIGTKLAYAHLRQQRIESGLASLRLLKTGSEVAQAPRPF